MVGGRNEGLRGDQIPSAGFDLGWLSRAFKTLRHENRRWIKLTAFATSQTIQYHTYSFERSSQYFSYTHSFSGGYPLIASTITNSFAAVVPPVIDLGLQTYTLPRIAHMFFPVKPTLNTELPSVS